VILEDIVADLAGAETAPGLGKDKSELPGEELSHSAAGSEW